MLVCWLKAQQEAFEIERDFNRSLRPDQVEVVVLLPNTAWFVIRRRNYRISLLDSRFGKIGTGLESKPPLFFQKLLILFVFYLLVVRGWFSFLFLPESKKGEQETE